MRTLLAVAMTVAADSSVAGIANDDAVAFWQDLAPLCEGFPSKEDCDDGDMALFGGLLCAVGDERGCALVRNSQDDDGRWWRSPRRKNGNLGGKKSFSRDMAIGVMLYLATTRDASAAERWLAWIESNRACVTPKPGGGCLLRGPHRFCTDDENQACTVTPANWSLLARIFAFLELPLNETMQRYLGIDTDTHEWQARHAPVGYQMHLPAAEVLLKRLLGVAEASRTRAAAALAEREPDNLFFLALAGVSAESLEDRLFALCPKRDAGPPLKRDQWAWERGAASRAWERSMGWDCLFLYNFLRRP